MIWFIFQTITVVSADGITAVNKTVEVGNSLLPTKIGYYFVTIYRDKSDAFR